MFSTSSVPQRKHIPGVARVNKVQPCSWDTQYQFSIKTLLSTLNKPQIPIISPLSESLVYIFPPLHRHLFLRAHIHLSPLFLCIYIPILTCTYLPISRRISLRQDHYFQIILSISIRMYVCVCTYSMYVYIHIYTRTTIFKYVYIYTFICMSMITLNIKIEVKTIEAIITNKTKP